MSNVEEQVKRLKEKFRLL